MTDAHDVALFTIAACCAIGALLIADAAEEVQENATAAKRQRMALLLGNGHVPVWVKPAALRCVGLSFLIGMAASGAFLVGAFP